MGADYIILLEMKEARIVMIILSVLSLFSLLYGLYQMELNKWKFNIKKQAGFILSVLFLIFAFLALKDYNNWRNFKNRYKTTVGETIQKKTYSKQSSQIEFKFVVDNKTYITECGFVYNGSAIKGIIETGGKYKVYYDPEKPEFAVMDFISKKD